MIEAPEDGRVEDGTYTECAVCGKGVYLYVEDKDVCRECATDGWTWEKAYTIRRGDVCLLGGEPREVLADESFGKGVVIHTAGEREFPLRNLTLVLVRAAS